MSRTLEERMEELQKKPAESSVQVLAEFRPPRIRYATLWVNRRGASAGSQCANIGYRRLLRARRSPCVWLECQIQDGARGGARIRPPHRGGYPTIPARNPHGASGTERNPDLE